MITTWPEPVSRILKGFISNLLESASSTCTQPNSNEHRYLGSRMDAIILNIFEINYSQLIRYEILEKLVTLMDSLGPEPYVNRIPLTALELDFVGLI